MKKVTFGLVWRDSPKEKKTMVSNYIHYSLSILKRSKANKILDAACGNGIGVTVPLAKLGYEVYSFDKHQSAINACSKNLKEIGATPRLQRADFYKRFPYKDSSFDAVYCFQAIYHGKIEQIMSALSEMRRVLKEGGYFFCTFMRFEDLYYDKSKNSYYFFVESNKKKIKVWTKKDEKQPHLTYYTDKSWEYGVPHYYASKEEIRCIMSQYFRDVKIKLVQGNTRYSKFWMAWGKK